MGATTNYQAGLDTSQVSMGYIQEAAWGVTPATPKLQALRLTGESLRGQETRDRPGEMNDRRVAARPATTEKSAAGGIDFAFSYGTYDDVLAGLLGGEWSATTGAATLVNGTVFKSFLLEKRFSATKLFQYPGSFFSAGTLNLARRQFLSGSFSVLSKEQKKAIVSASTGGTYTPAPGGDVIDPVGGVRDIMMDGVAIPSVCNSISLNISNDGAAADFGLGAAAAQGMRMGSFLVGGSVEFYFRDFDLFDRSESKLAGTFSFRTVDAAGNSYKFELPGSGIASPNIVAGGPGQPVMARYDLEGGSDANGVALRITRTPAAP